jgi:hypothetical protein
MRFLVRAILAGSATQSKREEDRRRVSGVGLYAISVATLHLVTASRISPQYGDRGTSRTQSKDRTQSRLQYLQQIAGGYTRPGNHARSGSRLRSRLIMCLWLIRYFEECLLSVRLTCLQQSFSATLLIHPKR